MSSSRSVNSPGRGDSSIMASDGSYPWEETCEAKAYYLSRINLFIPYFDVNDDACLVRRESFGFAQNLVTILSGPIEGIDHKVKIRCQCTHASHFRFFCTFITIVNS